MSKPGLISLGGGLPSDTFYPFDELSVKVPTVGQFDPQALKTSGQVITAGKHDAQEDKSLYDISIAFNYGLGQGSPQLLRFVIEHTEICHNPPTRDWDAALTIGSTSALDMCLRMLCVRGDVMLSEYYSFSAAVETALGQGIKTEGVPMDEQGLLPEAMDEILTSWEPQAREGARKPHILYTVPSGQNPTGATQSPERRKAIYKVAQKHDVIILEDEPYYFLQMQPYTGQDAPDPPAPKTDQEFLQALVPSLLSMDTDGRVLRFDSFSKVIAPGSRIGWITGATQLVQRYAKHADQSTQSPSGFSQLAIYKLLDEHWGHHGYLDWLKYIRMEYTRRRNGLLSACEDFLPSEIVTWKPPMAGMFHWIEIDWRKHPKAGELSYEQLEERIWLQVIENNALLARGSWFKADQGRAPIRPDEKMFFRATFCAASEENIRLAIGRFGETLKQEFGLTGKSNGHA